MGRWKGGNYGSGRGVPRCCKYMLLLLGVYLALASFRTWLTLIYVPVTDLESPEAACGQEFDAVLVLGGGVPLKEKLPPKWVQARAEAAAKVYKCLARKPVLLTLSAGTAHVPQLLDSHGLPGEFACRVRARVRVRRF